MDIKIVCGCGQKYIFEVNPEDGLMPGTVICPACGADGTQDASEILRILAPEAVAQPAAVTTVPPPVAAKSGPIRVSSPVTPPAPPPPPIPPPTTIKPLKSSAAKPTLAWYEHVWTALPLALVAVGGCIGGGIGGAAWAVNRQVFTKIQHPVLRYVVTGIISAAAVVVWLVVVSFVLGLLHKG